MRQLHSIWRRVIPLMLLAGLVNVAIAGCAIADEVDPPAQVARVSYLQGSVSLQVAGADASTDEWIQARINQPLTNHDQLWTDAGARAELQVGNATVQIDGSTQLGILELSDNVLQVQLDQGVINLNVRNMDNDDVIEIDTPNSAITIPEPGTYRIEVSSNDDATVVKVRAGSADITGERQQFSLRENEQLRLTGTERLNAQFDDLDRMDEFDQWAANRNSHSLNATAARYVDAQVIGYEDLDDYGYWNWEAGYGDVWHPTQVATGWSPYRFGHWNWIAPWGWTWIDDAPWGFAPFHYGRWAEVHHRWCWVPGPRNERAVYAPALVAWVGTPGVNISINTGAPVGWIPLGPHEIYRPSYPASAVYMARVNFSNSQINHEEFERASRQRPYDEVYVNRAAVSVIAAATFTSAGNVRRNLISLDPRQLHPVDNGFDLRPNKPASIGKAHIVTPPRFINRDIVVRHAPTPFRLSDNAPARNIATVGGSLHIIQSQSPRHMEIGNQQEERHDAVHNFNPPSMENNNNVNHDQSNNRHGRGNDNARLENGVNTNPGDNNSNNNPGNRTGQNRDDRHDVITPGFNPHINNQPSVQSLQQHEQQPEARKRIGPWVHDEEQLRHQPSQQQSPPVVTPPPPPASATHVEPPRQPSPPHNNSDDDERRRKIFEHQKIQ